MSAFPLHLIVLGQDADDLTAHPTQPGHVLLRVGKLCLGIKVTIVARHLEHVVDYYGDTAGPQTSRSRQHKDDAGLGAGGTYVADGIQSLASLVPQAGLHSFPFHDTLGKTKDRRGHSCATLDTRGPASGPRHPRWRLIVNVPEKQLLEWREH
jgi:hypothetical protein